MCESWLSRRRTPGDLETTLFDPSNKRKFLNENGVDVRLKQPGVRYDLLREMRRATLTDYRERIQAVFDQVFEKITGGQR